MKVHGNNKPSSLFTIEKQPKHKGFCLVRFFENAKRIDETTWEYNEYHLELRDTDNLAAEIESDYKELFEQAKASEPVDEVANIKEEVKLLMEANAALEDALCEMDAANEERIATIEDALCEIDMG